MPINIGKARFSGKAQGTIYESANAVVNVHDLSVEEESSLHVDTRYASKPMAAQDALTRANGPNVSPNQQGPNAAQSADQSVDQSVHSDVKDVKADLRSLSHAVSTMQRVLDAVADQMGDVGGNVAALAMSAGVALPIMAEKDKEVNAIGKSMASLDLDGKSPHPHAPGGP